MGILKDFIQLKDKSIEEQIEFLKKKNSNLDIKKLEKIQNEIMILKEQNLNARSQTYNLRKPQQKSLIIKENGLLATFLKEKGIIKE